MSGSREATGLDHAGGRAPSDGAWQAHKEKATLYAPLRLERAFLRDAAPALRLVRTGMGPERAKAARAAPGPVVVAGVGGGLVPGVAAGDIVVASEVRGGGSVVSCPSAPLLAGALRRLGLRVHVGPIASSPRPVAGAAGAPLAAAGVLAVDMESAWLAPAGAPFAAVRAIVDTPDRPLWGLGTPARGLRALRTLRRAVPALRQWAAATGARELRRQFPAPESDLVLVVGSESSSSSRRLVEDTGREGVPAHLVDDVSQVDLRWLAGARRVGIVAEASAPPHLVDELVRCLAGLGPLVHFTLPREVS